MSGKRKMKVVFRSEDRETVYCEDSGGKLRMFRTVHGKNADYGEDLQRGRIFAKPWLENGDPPNRNGKPLTEEEKAYRKGFRACYAEFERIRRGKRRYRSN